MVNFLRDGWNYEVVPAFQACCRRGDRWAVTWETPPALPVLMLELKSAPNILYFLNIFFFSRKKVNAKTHHQLSSCVFSQFAGYSMSFLCSDKTSDPVKPINPTTACQFNIPVSFWVATVAISLEQIILLTWVAIKEMWRFEAISSVQTFCTLYQYMKCSKSTTRKDDKDFHFTGSLIIILIVIWLKPIFEVGLFYKGK